MPSFRPLSLALALLAGLALWQPTPVQAERADRAKKLEIEADQFDHNDLTRVSVLTGNVVLTKGSLVIKADRVEVREGRDGFRTAVASGTGGRQATFRQKRDTPNEHIEGQADRLEYEERRDGVRFVNNAVVRLLRSGTAGDEITGNLITYDGTSEQFSVSGGPGRAGTAAGASGGRVRAVLAPREGTEAAEAARAAEAAASGTRR
ncbi:lipopolysaccharide transport periplasmic protein LptA [Piscinibacter sakaiensis]|nr:lipopolysaccharide transport periplasmic protein LptA [Piscinibacter sakaiensis]